MAPIASRASRFPMLGGDAMGIEANFFVNDEGLRANAPTRARATQSIWRRVDLARFSALESAAPVNLQNSEIQVFKRKLKKIAGK